MLKKYLGVKKGDVSRIAGWMGDKLYDIEKNNNIESDSIQVGGRKSSQTCLVNHSLSIDLKV